MWFQYNKNLPTIAFCRYNLYKLEFIKGLEKNRCFGISCQQADKQTKTFKLLKWYNKIILYVFELVFI